MSRNSSGIYSLPVAAYVPLTAIVATDMNINLNDISSALTLSVPLDGTAPMTGTVKAAAGSRTAPSYAFNDSLGLGFYLNTTESGMAIVIASVSVVLFTSVAATNPYAAYWAYPHTFNATVQFTGPLSITAINATTTISGDLFITQGIAVGFSGTFPTAGNVLIGDADFSWFADADFRGFEFDIDDSLEFSENGQFYVLTITGNPIFSIDDSGAFIDGYAVLDEMTAPSAASTDQLYIYAKDNGSSQTYIYAKGADGIEFPLGGPGSWEEISSFAVTASVASIVFSLSRLYSKIVVCGVSMSATADSTRQLIVEISDDAGGSYETALAGYFGGPSGSLIGSVGAVSAFMRPAALTAAAADFSFRVEFCMCNETSQPKIFSGHAGSLTDTRTFFGHGQTAVCDDIDAIRVRWDTGALIDAGTITLYGEIAP